MIVRIVALFLLAMAVLALFGRLRFPRIGRPDTRKCAGCGRFRIGKGPCDCGRGA